MSTLWIFMFAIWFIVELIGFFQKKEFRKRMKSGAVWSTILVSLSTVGQMTQNQNVFLQVAVCLALYGTVAGIIYFARLKVAMLWQNRKISSGET